MSSRLQSVTNVWVQNRSYSSLDPLTRTWYTELSSLSLTAMSPYSVNSLALEELQKLASWIHDNAEMQEVAKNTSKCVDKDRREKVRPFLDAQKYSDINVGTAILSSMTWLTKYLQGHGYAIYRIKGKAEIGLTPKYQSYFFPLSINSGELKIGEDILHPGDYIHFTSSLFLDSHLDCLIILLPDTNAE